MKNIVRILFIILCVTSFSNEMNAQKIVFLEHQKTYDTVSGERYPDGRQTIELADRNSDGYIYKGTITLTRVSSGIRETFYLFNKRGVDYVATSKSGPYYRLSRRMTINGIDYKM